MVLRRNCRIAVRLMVGIKWLLIFLLLAFAWHEARADEWYLSPGGVSLHQDRHAGYNERNTGISAAWKRDDEMAVSAGQYGNSLHRRSYFAAVRWTPVSVGPLRAGMLAGVVTGYDANGGGPIPVVLPAVVGAVGPIEVTVIGWPSMVGSGAGIAAHFSVRVW